jgi:hypothetical protein
MNRLPTFIIAGAQKSGTTTLHHYLKAHSSVYIPPHPQELHFFDIEENFEKGVDWYQRHFMDAGTEHVAVGQTSPLYIYEPRAASRMAQLLPKVSLIFILRNPVDRAYSHYWHQLKKGRETRSFEDALAQEPARIAEGFEQWRHFSYADRGRYARQLEEYLRYFPREQMLLLLTEDLSQAPAAVIDKCCDFLDIARQGTRIVESGPRQRWNVSRLPRSERIQRLRAKWRSRSLLSSGLVRLIDRVNLRTAPYPPMDPAIRSALQSMFAEDNERLAALFELDLSVWS